MKNPFGIPSQHEREYAAPERLADVMALIQVLALDEDTYRSEDGLVQELQGSPRSAEDWTQVAQAHPEFFRVNVERGRVALVARHVTPKNPSRGKELAPEFVAGLLRSAIDIHDRQVRRSERWTYLVPIWVALITGLLAIVGLVITYLLKA